MEEIYGFIESIVYATDTFTVARLKEPRKSELTCIVGPLPSIQPGETVRCRGSWKNHKSHGIQFEVTFFESTQPSDLIGIQKYLESGLIKGIGPAFAERIIKKFGIETLKVIDETPHLLLDVEGIGQKRVDMIGTCWEQQKAIREVMIFLRSNNVSPAYAQKIFKKYGNQSIEKVKENPFALAKNIHGIGFKTADSIAKQLGIQEDAPVRIDAGIEYGLWELSKDGHTCFPEDELSEAIKEMLGINQDLIAPRIDTLVQQGVLVREEGFIWVRAFYNSEKGIAKELARLIDSISPLRTIDFDKAITWVQEKLNIQLAVEQKSAVLAATSKKVHIITGGPGTGKSTITRAILAITEKITGNILLAAPTGRAAKRMSEITQKKASTIHALLEMDFTQGGFKKNRENPLSCDLIIIDEASMIDTLLMFHLLRAIPSSSRVIFIGDIDQLPSVGPGNVLKDIIASSCIGVTKLTEIFRQAKGSRIITNAHKINNGEFPDTRREPGSDFVFIQNETPEEVLATILDLVTFKLSKMHRFHRFTDIQILCPMKKGIIGTDNLNTLLQQKLNPSPTPLSRMGRNFHVGDKVMQIRNDYQKLIFNGDVGRITSIDLADQRLTVSFDGRSVEYEFTEIDDLVLAYAVSIHKYQGSECPCVIIPVHTTHFKMLHRNLIYTGLTRGKKMVVMVGTKKALAIAVKNDEVKKRHTGLKSSMLSTLNTL